MIWELNCEKINLDGLIIACCKEIFEHRRRHLHWSIADEGRDVVDRKILSRKGDERAARLTGNVVVIQYGHSPQRE